MKKILVGMFAAVALFSFCGLAVAEQRKNYAAPPEGLEAADAVELVLGAVDSALIRDKGKIRRGFGFKGITIERSYLDKSVTYRNGTWIVQPLPLRETSESDPISTALLLGIICLVVSVFRNARPRSRC